jgi:hypothetical protein
MLLPYGYTFFPSQLLFRTGPTPHSPAKCTANYDSLVCLASLPIHPPTVHPRPRRKQISTSTPLPALLAAFANRAQVDSLLDMENNSVAAPVDVNKVLTASLTHMSGAAVLAHFMGFPMRNMPEALNDAAVVCLDAEWWEKKPHPTTELGVSEMMLKGLKPSAHAENLLMGILTAHARIAPHAHLRNTFKGAGDPDYFSFGTTKFVTVEEAKQVLVDTFNRIRPSDGVRQPIILVGHAVENEFDHLQKSFGVNLLSYGSIVKVIDTQIMAAQAGIFSSRGPNIGLGDLLLHFNIHMPNLHTAGNDAAATLMAAVLTAGKGVIYPFAMGNIPAIVDGIRMSDVMQRVMDVRKSLPPPVWGTTVYCVRCGRDNHVRAQCVAKVNCTICRDSGVVKLFKAHTTHDTSKCLYQYFTMPERDYMPAIEQAEYTSEQAEYGSREVPPRDDDPTDFWD